MAQLSTVKPAPVTVNLPLGKWALRLTAVLYVGLLVAVPVVVIAIKGLEGGLGEFWESVSHPIAYNAIRRTLWTSAVMTVINTIMGTLTAYVLVKYRFPGKALFNAFIDLPFAIPTLVTGVMLVLLYGPQTEAGLWVEENTGQRVIYAPLGIVLALLFVSYPFVIRTVQPVLMELESNQEEAAHTLGAYNWGTFWRVIFPAIRPAMMTGALLSFARALGEFGSIVVVSGNIPMKSQTATTYLYGRVEGGDMQGASGISLVLIVIALLIMLSVNFLRDHSLMAILGEAINRAKGVENA